MWWKKTNSHPKEVHVLTSRTYDYVRLHGAKELR